MSNPLITAIAVLSASLIGVSLLGLGTAALMATGAGLGLAMPSLATDPWLALAMGVPVIVTVSLLGMAWLECRGRVRSEMLQRIIDRGLGE